MNHLACLALIIVLIGPLNAQEKTESGTRREVTVRDGESVSVRLALADAASNLLSVVSFPEPIAQIVSAWNPKDLSVEQEGSRVFLKLLSKTQGHLDVILTSGAHVRLFLALASSLPTDSHVAVKLPDARRVAQGTSASGALDLIRAMRLGEIPAGVTIRAGKKEILFETKVIEARMLLTYDTGRFSGLVVELANRSEAEAYHVDLTRFAADRLVVAGVRDVVLKPASSTKLFLVFWK